MKTFSNSEDKIIHEAISQLEVDASGLAKKVAERMNNKQTTKQRKNIGRLRFASIATALVATFVVGVVVVTGGFDSFIGRGDTIAPDLYGDNVVEVQTVDNHSWHENVVFNPLLDPVDAQPVPPAREFPQSDPALHGHGNDALNPPLDDSQSITLERSIVSVIFVCDKSQPLRNLVINTPGSFTIVAPEAMSENSSASFQGWRDSQGNLWTPGTMINWTTEVGGTLTLAAEWL